MVRLALMAFLGVFAVSACANSEFASSAGTTSKKSDKDKDKDKDDDSDTDKDGTDAPDAGDEDSKDGKTEAGEGDDNDLAGTGGTDEDGEGTEGDLSEDEELVNKTPGVAVTKVGVNFEDTIGGDNDYNDAVLCFEGKFKVDASNVVSIAKQTVVATTFSNAGCSHQVNVEIVKKDGTKGTPITYNTKSFAPVQMEFEVGSKLEVSLTILSGKCTGGTMHDATRAVVAPNVCNNK